ncbi:carbohydrate ABC transporter permease [Vallitalea okinawensis]|uniref:carbohydrate ABC transporter permease n=1 Tax=Vallitalea okinawensis TaxID=2078660 RepID=UPI000CFD8C41|nr:carbohydrate ABC transporter permease [Vallitalea okinawensis]
MKERSIGNRIFNTINVIVLTILALATLYPFWEVLVSSISSYEGYLATDYHILPTEVDLTAYKYIFRMEGLWSSYGVTIFITVVGTLINMLLTITTGYVLSKEDLKGTKIIMFLIVFTMLFSGGLIPSYMVVKNLGIMNTVWALIMPTAISTYNLIIMKNFFMSIPKSIEESAIIDGCTDIGVLFKIVIPLSMPAIATISLFYAVYHWNDYFQAVLYITNREKWPLQLFLRSMLFENEASSMSGGDDPYLLGTPIKMAAVMVALIPIISTYPFFQKYFVKGVMIGSVKG